MFDESSVNRFAFSFLGSPRQDIVQQGLGGAENAGTLYGTAQLPAGHSQLPQKVRLRERRHARSLGIAAGQLSRRKTRLPPIKPGKTR